MFNVFEGLPSTPWSRPDREEVWRPHKRLFAWMAVAAGLITGLCVIGLIYLR
jgi:hypothetical protein